MKNFEILGYIFWISLTLIAVCFLLWFVLYELKHVSNLSKDEIKKESSINIQEYGLPDPKQIMDLLNKMSDEMQKFKQTEDVFVVSTKVFESLAKNGSIHSKIELNDWSGISRRNFVNGVEIYLDIHMPNENVMVMKRKDYEQLKMQKT